MRAYISAHLADLTLAQNARRTDQLFGELYRGGLNPREVSGCYKGVREVAFSVPIPHVTHGAAHETWQFKELLALGRAYEQETILLVTGLGLGKATLWDCDTGRLVAKGQARRLEEIGSEEGWTTEVGIHFTVGWE